MYGNNAKLLFTDTDSVCYEIQTKGTYKDLWAKRDLFDFSDYTKDSPYFDPTNTKVPGKFKDECAGKPMGGFAGFRSKMYSYLMDDGKNRVFSLTWPASMQIYWNERKRLHKKRVQLPEDLFGTPISLYGRRDVM